MENSSLLKKIEGIAIEILKAKESVSKETSTLLPEIVEEFKKRNDEIKETTLSAYLSKLTRIETSPIKSAGKKRGFYCIESALPVSPSSALYAITSHFEKDADSQPQTDSPLGEEKTPTIEDGEKSPQKNGARTQIEKKLYPIVRDWLVAEGYNAAITADKTGNGKWGNPDVTGIKVIGTVSENKEVEIATVEVKISHDNWRQFIFEAVSHTRFSNSTYYCFAYPESSRNSFDSEFYMYAEEFELGILGIEMEDSDFEKFVKNEFDPKFEEVEVIELNTPRFRSLRPYFREKFLRTLEIESLKDLILWPNPSASLKPAS